VLGFNHLLEQAGVPVATTKLVRHQDNRGRRDRSPFRLWQGRREEFELYQSIQRRLPFKLATHVASFVAAPNGDTLFVGVWEIGPDVGVVPAGTIDPVTQEDVGGLNLYALAQSPALADYQGRVVVEWGDGYRSWAQNARSQDKQVLEIRRTPTEERFPGLLAFRRGVDELDTMPESWRVVLSENKGVYLLICRATGKFYVGSAYGQGGFLGRWEEYAASGHGGNIQMKAHAHRDWQVSILEVAASSDSDADVIAREAVWKEKLLSLKFGLNAN
jgi:hypothetical protein